MRAFEGRVVRATAAADVVIPMPESGDETPASPDPDAYAPSPPVLHLYRQDTTEGSHAGLVGTTDAAAFVDGRVLGHEGVQPDRVAALVAHLDSGAGQMELVTTLHAAGPCFTSATVPRTDPALVDVTSRDGVRHRLWPLDPDADLLEELSAARHYVADGHHRVAASVERWERAGRPERFAVGTIAYARDGLALEAFHRRLAGPVDPEPLLARLADGYDLREVVEPEGALTVRTGGRWYAATGRVDPAGLEVARLEAALAGDALEPVRIDVATLRDDVDREDGAGFVLAPPPVDLVLALADAGERVPAKTTYFRPKPASGLLLPRVP